MRAGIPSRGYVASVIVMIQWSTVHLLVTTHVYNLLARLVR